MLNRMKVIRIALVLALIAGPLAALLATTAYAQGGVISGNMFDLTGKPYPNVTITFTNNETNKTSETKTDAKGHYAMPGVAGGTYNVDFKAKDADGKDQLVYQAGLKITAGTSPTFDINLKDLQAAGKLAGIEAVKERAVAERQFQDLKTHYEA